MSSASDVESSSVEIVISLRLSCATLGIVQRSISNASPAGEVKLQSIHPIGQRTGQGLITRVPNLTGPGLLAKWGSRLGLALVSAHVGVGHIE